MVGMPRPIDFDTRMTCATPPMQLALKQMKTFFLHVRFIVGKGKILAKLAGHDVESSCYCCSWRVEWVGGIGESARHVQEASKERDFDVISRRLGHFWSELRWRGGGASGIGIVGRGEERTCWIGQSFCRRLVPMHACCLHFAMNHADGIRMRRS